MRRRVSNKRIAWRRPGATLALVCFLLQSLAGVGSANVVTHALQDNAGGGVAYIEICTPTGIKRIAWPGSDTEPNPGDSSPTSPSWVPCLLCKLAGACALPGVIDASRVVWDTTTAFVPAHDSIVGLSTVSPREHPSRAPPRLS